MKRSGGPAQRWCSTRSSQASKRIGLCWLRCIASLEPGDTVLVTKSDRLARSYPGPTQYSSDNRRSWGRFRSLGNPWADTTSPHGQVDADCAGWVG